MIQSAEAAFKSGHPGVPEDLLSRGALQGLEADHPLEEGLEEFSPGWPIENTVDLVVEDPKLFVFFVSNQPVKLVLPRRQLEGQLPHHQREQKYPQRKDVSRRGVVSFF
jgi:hypothetical protein